MDNPKISDFHLEKLVLGLLPAPEARDLQERIEADPDLKSRYNTIRVHNETLLQEIPPHEVAAEVQRRLRFQDMASSQNPQRPLVDWFSPQMAWGGLALAALILGLVFLLPPVDENAPNPPGYRIKGAPTLLLHRVQGDVAHPLRAEDLAQKGDRIQLSIAGGSNLHAVVLSLDGNGQVTLHHPLHGQKTSALEETKTPFNLPQSYKLDAAPQFERFFLITSTEALEPNEFLREARNLAKRAETRQTVPLPNLPQGTLQSSILLRKAPLP